MILEQEWTSQESMLTTNTQKVNGITTMKGRTIQRTYLLCLSAKNPFSSLKNYLAFLLELPSYP